MDRGAAGACEGGAFCHTGVLADVEVGVNSLTWLAPFTGAVVRNADGDLGQYAPGEQIQTPAGFNPPDPDTLYDDNVQRDQEYIRHRKLSEDMKRRQETRAGQAKLNKCHANDLHVRRKDRKEGHQKCEKHVAAPERLKP